MNTKVIVIGQKNQTVSKKKAIELNHVLTDEFKMEHITIRKPSQYEYVELITKNYFPGVDLIYCYFDPIERDGCLFFGKWNDGVVEGSN